MNELAVWIGVVIALLALVGPALVWIGIRLGALQAATSAAHHRIDETDARFEKHEERMDDRFEKLTQTLSQAIKNGWRHCPLATAGEPHKHGEG